MEIIKLPQEVNELSSKVSPNKKQEVESVLNQIFAGTKEWEKRVDSIEVKDINDRMGIQIAETVRKNLKQARISAEKVFDTKREEVKNLKIEFDLEDKLWLKAKQVMQLTFKAIEDKAEWKANIAKRYEAEQKELIVQNRIMQLSQYAQTVNRVDRAEIEDMTDIVFRSFLNGIKVEYELKKQAEKEEAEAKEKQLQIEAEAKERQRIENEMLRAEAEALELEAKKLQAELKAKEDAEQKAIADKLAAEETELSKGDKQKMLDLLDQLVLVGKNPTFKSKKFQAVQNYVNDLIEKIVVFTNEKIK